MCAPVHVGAMVTSRAGAASLRINVVAIPFCVASVTLTEGFAPVGIVGVPDKLEYAPVVATAARPLTPDAGIVGISAAAKALNAG